MSAVLILDMIANIVLFLDRAFVFLSFQCRNHRLLVGFAFRTTTDRERATWSRRYVFRRFFFFPQLSYMTVLPFQDCLTRLFVRFAHFFLYVLSLSPSFTAFRPHVDAG
ncbi:hypothetical protein B0H16DRAFT_173507 [Mycena metata]|uniref:Uncharacterized protein n=1 Tax=Mycena metata TaxID=1033252 RepID=A0AAD7I176_9AGAR|nr:hypothetical protein B0H16DRAFT_173507 [Mycena metata]